MKDNEVLWGFMVALVVIWLAGYLLAGVNVLEVIFKLAMAALAAG